MRSVAKCSNSKGEYYKDADGEVVVINYSDCLDLGETIKQDTHQWESEMDAYANYLEESYNYPSDYDLEEEQTIGEIILDLIMIVIFIVVAAIWSYY